LIGVDLGVFFKFLDIQLVMRHRVMRVRHTNLRKTLGRLLTANKEREDPRNIRLKRQCLKVEH